LSERGRLIVFAAPAGAGKSTLIARLRQNHPEWGFSVSATTRAPRPGERDGREYFFLGRDDFQRRVDTGEFFEHEEVHGEWYGTLREPTVSRLARGETLIFDLDVNGALNVKAAYPSALTIFVQPPSREALRERLTQRATESADLVELRLTRADMEFAQASRFDIQVVNQDLERALEDLESQLHARMDHSS
jgi:guanylate kinase